MSGSVKSRLHFPGLNETRFRLNETIAALGVPDSGIRAVVDKLVIASGTGVLGVLADAMAPAIIDTSHGVVRGVLLAAVVLVLDWVAALA